MPGSIRQSPRFRIPAPAVMGARENDPSDAARSDQPLGRDHLRTGAPTVGDPQGHAVSPTRGDHFATLGRVSRHRLLAQNVLSVLRRQAGVVAMGIGRRRHDDSFHLVVAHQLRRRAIRARAIESRRECLGCLKVATADSDEIGSFRSQQARPERILGYGAAANDAKFHSEVLSRRGGPSSSPSPRLMVQRSTPSPICAVAVSSSHFVSPKLTLYSMLKSSRSSAKRKVSKGRKGVS